ncbi:LysE family translocator [Chthonobacter albigriseus]|uniref:LysE family translocator n=1 Tax=Chthonobacter albigriseus TaxID=1683161 RepID=UPI0015EE6F7E|nr:LysE family translocator [Chthonobacter albigriseus]
MTFLPDLTVLLGFTVAVVFLTLTPGPDMALFLGKTVAQGRPAGFAAFMGTNAGLLVHSTLAAVGLSAVLAASETAFTALKVAGALYLAYLAVEAVRKGAAFSIDPAKAVREPLGRIALKGFLVNVLNPKIIVFFVTFLPQFIDAGDPHAAGKLMFLGLWLIAVAFPITAAMILGAERIAGFLKRSPRALRAFDWIFAGVMGAFAVRLLLAKARG